MALDDSSDGNSGRFRIPDGLVLSVARARARLSNAFRRLSPQAGLALTLGTLAAVLLGISAFFFLPSATLQIVCRHDFRSAAITVSVDGDVVHTDNLTGSVRKVLGVVEKTEGSYSKSIPVGAGRHVVSVQLSAQGYDRTRSIEGEFSRGKESVLSVDSGRGLSLAWRSGVGGSSGDTASASSSLFKYAGSALMTIFGSILSASIGVLVQDLLRARKNRANETGEVQPQRSKISS